MLDIDHNLQVVLLIFITTIALLYKQKPSMMFKKNGKPKEFGSGKDKTITPVWLVSIAISLLVYVQLTVKGGDFV